MRGIGPNTIEKLRTAATLDEVPAKHFGGGERWSAIRALISYGLIEWENKGRYEKLRVTERGKALCDNASELR